jgi:hypothetical protein
MRREQKTETFQIRCTPGEKASIYDMAARKGVSASEFVRGRALSTVDPIPAPRWEGFVRDLRRIRGAA